MDLPSQQHPFLRHRAATAVFCISSPRCGGAAVNSSSVSHKLHQPMQMGNGTNGMPSQQHRYLLVDGSNTTAVCSVLNSAQKKVRLMEETACVLRT